MKKIKLEEKGTSLIIIIIIIITIIAVVGITTILLMKYSKNSISKVDDNSNPNLNEDTIKISSTKITGTIPYIPNGFSKSSINGETTVEEGLVIKDNNGNEYVWIPVPNDQTGPNYSDVINTQVDSKEYYEEIEQALLDYTEDVRDYSGILYIDDYSEYSKTTEEILGIKDYNVLKKKMLKSIYINEGFYIGRYETGTTKWWNDIYNGESDTMIETLINLSSEKLKTLCEPVIQKDSYPYIFLTCKQAQQLSELFESGEYNSSLMFGIQWNLVLKYLKRNENKDCEDSTSWGNYRNNSFHITSNNAKCISENTDDEIKWILTPSKKEIDEFSILTTGASQTTKALNIYDIAGDVEEYTLERNGRDDSEDQPIVVRGGSADDDGDFHSASAQRSYGYEDNQYGIGFRVCIY